jgi:hypothetical protein
MGVGFMGRHVVSCGCPQVLKRMSPMVDNRLTIRAEHDPSITVWADDQRLYQAVSAEAGGLCSVIKGCCCPLQLHSL